MTDVNLALWYLEQGWSVIPCHVPIRNGCSCGEPKCAWPGKHPRISWRQYSERRATESEVREWFEDSFYGSNIGVVTGRISNLVVLDLDGDISNYLKLDMPATLTSMSGSGGLHFYFRSKKPFRSKGRFVEGIDLKADGGFIVMPPSRHKSGHRYEWLIRMQPTKLPIDQLPLTSDMTAPMSSNEDKQWFVELLKGVSEGDRSNTAAKLAGRYAHLGITRDEAWLLMSSWNERNTPPLDPHEIAGTIRWAYHREQENSVVNLKTKSDILKLLSPESYEGR